MCESIARKSTGIPGIGAETAPIGPPGISNSEPSLNDPDPESSAISVRQKPREEIAEGDSREIEAARVLRVASAMRSDRIQKTQVDGFGVYGERTCFVVFLINSR